MIWLCFYLYVVGVINDFGARMAANKIEPNAYPIRNSLFWPLLPFLFFFTLASK